VGPVTKGSSISIDDDFFVARPTDSVQKINSALAQGPEPALHPCIYYLTARSRSSAPTRLCWAGLPDAVPNNGVVAMSVADVPGVKLSGLLFDAGPAELPGPACRG